MSNYKNYYKFLDSFNEVNKHKKKHYKNILKSSDIKLDDFWSDWYNSGGYGYESQNALDEIREIPYIWKKRLNIKRDLTCLDVGSGDGFWSYHLSYFFKVTGIEPVDSAVYLSNEYKKKFKAPINETKFIVGDALTHIPETKYDVTFCRAPQFFNYPMIDKYNPDLKDKGYEKLFDYWMRTTEKKSAQKMIKRYKSRGDDDAVEKYIHYSNNAREYLEHLVSITNECLIFIMSSKKEFFRTYLGGTYNHHPEDIKKMFKEFGKVKVNHLWDSYIIVTLNIKK